MTQDSEAAPSRLKKAAPALKGEESTRGLGKVMLRNDFYRDGYRLALRIAIVQAVTILALIGAMYFIISVHQPENRYFATTEDGRLIPMVALNQPNLSTPALLSWVAQSVSETMSFSFSNYRRNLQESSRHFTKAGWESFSTALESARTIETVVENSQEVTAVPRGAPVLKSEGISPSGQYQWVVQVPIMVSYVSGTKKSDQSWIVTVVVVRVPRLESPNGVGIAQWIAVPG